MTGLSAISGVMQSDAKAKVKINCLCLILSVVDDERYIDWCVAHGILRAGDAATAYVCLVRQYREE